MRFARTDAVIAVRRLALGLGGTAFLLAGGTVLADDDSGWYVGADVGTSSNDDFVSANNDGSLSMIRSDESDTGYRVYGGYEFGPHVGVEAGYEDHGETSFTAESDGTGYSWEAGSVGTRFESDGWFAAVVGRLPLSERWTLFARLGLYSWETTETFTEPSGTTVDKNSGTDATYGAGVEYDVGKKGDWVLLRRAARRPRAHRGRNRSGETLPHVVPPFSSESVRVFRRVALRRRARPARPVMPTR